ncbi:MAG: hypothetical protein IKN64_12440 [Desulfovibrio sp.]|nr:hypothetical protein [Desulfovibrio sp.]
MMKCRRSSQPFAWRLNADLAIELLSHEGFQVDRANDGDVCVSMLSQAPAGTWNAVLMDIQMQKWVRLRPDEGGRGFRRTDRRRRHLRRGSRCMA